MCIHVVGIGLDGKTGLSKKTIDLIQASQLLIGSRRHLTYFPDHPKQRTISADLPDTIEIIHAFQNQHLDVIKATIVILTSGDPLFFGLGRLLLEHLPAEQLTFHPHLGSIQLAFNRLKLPWHDAQWMSIHGRSIEHLISRLQQGVDKLAILTDPTHNPAAIAQVLIDLDLPHSYNFWVCENLGGEDEQIHQGIPVDFLGKSFASLNVVVLVRDRDDRSLDRSQLPMLGIPDTLFCSFGDRPGLMTKREVRTLVLAELALQPRQVVWDIGAGTGSVSIEIARLCPDSQIYAIEKTSAGQVLIQQNCQRFQVSTVTAIPGKAPECLANLPDPDRVFIGGSGGELHAILDYCAQRLLHRTEAPTEATTEATTEAQAVSQNSGPDLRHPLEHSCGQKRMVLALATVEHLSIVQAWAQVHPWSVQFRHVQLSRSTTVANLTRYVPLNPVTLLILIPDPRNFC